MIIAKKEAKEIAAKLIADFNSSLCGDHSQLTISEYSEIWFEHMKPIIRSNTMDSYKRDMNRHVIPLLGKKKINQLHQKDVENFIHPGNSVSAMNVQRHRRLSGLMQKQKGKYRNLQHSSPHSTNPLRSM